MLAILLASCGGGSGGDTSSQANSGQTISVAVTPYKGMFTSGTVSVADASGHTIATGPINSNGSSTVAVPSNAVYPLTYMAQGTYRDEATGSISTNTVPLRAVVADAETAAKGVAVTLLSEFAAALIDQRVAGGAALTATLAKSSLTTVASAVLGLTYEQAIAPPVFDLNGKTTDPNTLKLAGLALAASTLGSGSDLVAKVKSLSVRIASGSNVDSVITQSAFNAAMNLVNSAAGLSGQLPVGTTPLSLPPTVIVSFALGSADVAAVGLRYLSWDSPTTLWADAASPSNFDSLWN